MQPTPPIEDWDDAYANSAHIEGAVDFPPRWERLAREFRAGLGARAQTGIAYGDGARQRYDLFLPEGEPRGLAVFVHGGYWRAFDPSSWSHLAAGALARGWACAAPGYTLCPEATIPQITCEVGEAVDAAAGRIAGPIRLAGHSAGGHLVCRMICAEGPLPAGAAGRIERSVSISGVHDLRPLLRTEMNADLRLDEAAAAAESPALLRPREGAALIAWVGAEERPEFRRQTDLIVNVWRGLGAATAARHEPDRHHFDVIDGLADPASPLCEAFLGP